MAGEHPRFVLESYKPTPEAWEFHNSGARFRFLIWGIKGGKSLSGAVEFTRGALGSKPNSLNWVVAPTYGHLQVAEREVMSILRGLEKTTGQKILRKRNLARHESWLPGERLIQFRSAEWPDNLRGPNVDGACWVDEGAFMKAEAWWILLERVSATGAGIHVTTTPRGRNWIWQEVQESGMSFGAPYGEWEKGDHFVSHWPTWHFPWVPRKDIEKAKRTMPRGVFAQEYGAKFVGGQGQVFANVADLQHHEPLPKPDDLSENQRNSFGLDLAKFQDFTAVVVMDRRKRILWVERWNKVNWGLQKERIKRISRQWKATIVLDRSNVGSAIEDDLRKDDMPIIPVDMNAPQTKRDLIDNLLLAFENEAIKIPHPSSRWAPPEIQQLCNELDWYERNVTPKGNVTYSAPKGLTDDFVIATALALWGVNRGVARGEGDESQLGMTMSREEFDKLEVLDGEKQLRRAMAEPRKKIMSGIFGKRRNASGLEGTGGPFWRR